VAWSPRVALGFGNESGLTSTATLPGLQRFGALGSKMLNLINQSAKLGGAHMRIDRYTKTILTIIALLLAVIVLKPLFQPQPAMAEGKYAGVQFSYSGGNHAFFDTRTGDVWEYGEDGHYRQHHKIHEFGKDHDH
jgi:hypothetical protein